MPDPVLEEVKKGITVSDIAAVVVTTASKKYLIKTGTEANFRAAVDAGRETPLRKQNTILAMNKTEDILKGYDVDLTDVLMHPEVLALVDGGVATFGGTPVEFQSYTGPVAGQPVVRTPFDLDIYASNFDTDGDVVSYLQFTLKNCKGKPTEFTIRDGEFYTPKYTMESRPAGGESPITIAAVKTLPAVT
jgi:hypothetical protein